MKTTRFGANCMNNASPQDWDVWYASVLFEDSNETKNRPVIIIDAQDALTVIAMKLTSKPARLGEYSLSDWASAGLKSPTVARISKIAKLPKQNLIRRFGALSQKDQNAITDLMLKYYQLKK